MHSKYYRSPLVYSGKKILVIGNSASGQDLTTDLKTFAHLPVYQSRRSKSRWDGDKPPPGVEWKPIVQEYKSDGSILFADGTSFSDIDTVIYCTGYKISFPFWNVEANGRPLWDYKTEHSLKGYWHTFFQDFQTLGIVGLPRVLTFRSFEYQAIALARLFAGRNALSLPPLEEQQKWERERVEESQRLRKKFHDIPWENGETTGWLGFLFRIAGLGTLEGEGRIPPVLGKDLIWAIEHLRKYPEPGKGTDGQGDNAGAQNLDKSGDIKEEEEQGWVVVEEETKDLLAFI